jgi:hypothetical protein
MKQEKNQVQKTCTMCGETKPRNEFKRRLSKRQSASLLRRGSVQTALTVISSRCRSCWSATKSRKPLTIKQIKNKKASGDLRGVVADILLTQRKQNANAIKSRVMKEYWEKQKTAPIKQLEQNLRQQVAKYANRYHATKSKDPHHALLRQHRENYEMAKRARDELLSRAKAGEVFGSVNIAEYFRKGVSHASD